MLEASLDSMEAGKRDCLSVRETNLTMDDQVIASRRARKREIFALARG
jgi:uncharacterized NAD(P)/FAD-binding protein YdhS